MEHFDTIVIGGGVLGCFAARNLCRWNLSVLLLEAEGDVCTGITRANSAIVYAGYDMKPGTRKAEMTVRANAGFDLLCRELDVPFARRGSLMVSFGPRGEKSLQKKLENGLKSQVPGLRLLTGDEARQLEPMLSPAVTAALYAPSTGTVNPWELGIAAHENATENGCQSRMNTRVTAITKVSDGYQVKTNQGEVHCRAIVNCAGLEADTVQNLLFSGETAICMDGTDYLVMNPQIQAPTHIIFQEAETGKGITAIPCVEGNLLLESPARPLTEPFATTREGMECILLETSLLLPQLDTTAVIRSFGAVRPNPQRGDVSSLHDFCIEQLAPDFISFIGIKTPGLTCANELGMYAAEVLAQALKAVPNLDFDPIRRISSTRDDQIICQCRNITRGDVLQAIRRGATTLDGVKHRAGTGMGPCQGSRCAWEIEKLLEEYSHGTL